MTQAELNALGEELGLDVIGAAPAEPYAETERHIRERRARGLFADMRFTMAQPETSCHPERLLPGARTVISAALCYYTPAPEPKPGDGRLPRYTWEDGYAKLRERIDELGNTGGPEHAAAAEGYADHEDPLLREHAEWALARIAERLG